jgi:hypothetical protein
MSELTQNDCGEWVAAIPVPRCGRWFLTCQCGRRFRHEVDYRGHYALVHVLGLR